MTGMKQDNNRMSTKLLLLLLMLVWSASCVSTSYTGTLSGQNTFQQQSFPIPAGNGILSLYFNITNMPYSNTLLLVSFAPITLNLTAQQLSSLVASGDPLLSYMNLMAAIGDSPQLINIYIPSSASTLYVGVFNFDLPEVDSSKSYYMTIQFSNNIKICEKCPQGSSTAGLSCQCTPCYSNAIGPACQYSLTPLTSSANFTLPVNQNRYFLISGGSNVQISAQEMTLTGGVTLYAQYQYISDQYPEGVLAGKINTAYSGTQPAQLTLTPIVATLTLPYKGLNILLTFHNYGNTTASISVSIPTTPTATISLTLIMAVVFSLLGLAVVIVVAYRIRRCLSARNSIVLNVGPAVLADHNSLTDAEVNKYFPEVSAAILLQTDINASSSEININNESSLNRVDRIDIREMLIECSICFDEVKASHLARVTYCRHIFHSNCLLEWFHKNQICPNCRQPCDYVATSKFRKTLGRSAKANSNSLVKAILGDNFLSQLQTKAKPTKRDQEFTKLQESKDFQEKEMKQVERVMQEVQQQEATDHQVAS